MKPSDPTPVKLICAILYSDEKVLNEAANQLIAALTLIVISSWFLSRRKPVLYTVLPMIFMLFTAGAALVLKIMQYSRTGESLLLSVAIVLLCLAGFVLVEALAEIRNIYRKKKNLLGRT